MNLDQEIRKLSRKLEHFEQMATISGDQDNGNNNKRDEQIKIPSSSGKKQITIAFSICFFKIAATTELETQRLCFHEFKKN